MKERTLFVFILLAMGSYCYVQSREKKALMNALYASDAGFHELLNKEIKGHKLFEYIDPNSVGTFRIKDTSFACAQLNTPLPVLPQKKK